MGYSRKNPSQTDDSGRGDMEFPRVLKKVEIPGVSWKRSGISTGVFTKTQVEWLGGNQKNVWMFGLIYIIHLPILKIFFKFPKICGVKQQTYLNSSHKFIQYNCFLKCTCDIG